MKNNIPICIFVPWTKEVGVSIKTENKWWQERAAKVSNNPAFFQILHWTGHPLPELLSFHIEGKIYIVGHGGAGKDIVSPAGITSPHILTAREVGERLIQSGLKPEFKGSLKCFTCSSASPIDAANGQESFAQLFADFMVSNGYTNCAFQGYTKSISSRANSDGHKKAGERASFLCIPLPWNTSVGTAKEYRASIKGRYNQDYEMKSKERTQV